MKATFAFLLLAGCIASAYAGKAESLVLPTFAPPSPPPPPMTGFGCPSLELAFVLHQYSYLNFGNEEGAAVCKAIRSMTPYKYAKCEFVYRYGYRSSNELPALLEGVVAGENPSTVVFLSIKFGIPQLPNQQKWYDYAAKNRTKLMSVLSYQPTLEAKVQKAIHWDGDVTTLENCAAFMYGYDTYTSDPFEYEFTYWEPHPSPPDVLPDSSEFVPTPPFIYFGGKGCPCYYDVDIVEYGTAEEETTEGDWRKRKLMAAEEELTEEELLALLEEEGSEEEVVEEDTEYGSGEQTIVAHAQDFDNPTCQIFLNSDNEPASKYYNFPDSYWSAFAIGEKAAYGIRGCLAELPTPDPTKCTYKGVYAIESKFCPKKLLSFSIADCGQSTINLRTSRQAKGARKEWFLGSSFNSEGATTSGAIRANRNCPTKYMTGAAGKLASTSYLGGFKIMPTGTDCNTVYIVTSKASKYLGVGDDCNGLAYGGSGEHNAVFRLKKIR